MVTGLVSPCAGSVQECREGRVCFANPLSIPKLVRGRLPGGHRVWCSVAIQFFFERWGWLKDPWETCTNLLPHVSMAQFATVVVVVGCAGVNQASVVLLQMAVANSSSTNTTFPTTPPKFCIKGICTTPVPQLAGAAFCSSTCVARGHFESFTPKEGFLIWTWRGPPTKPEIAPPG